MEQPKEPGFYWAMIPWDDAPGEWVPVHLMEYGRKLIVLVPGDEQEIDPAELSWGPRIEPPGKNLQGRLTGRSAPLDTGEVLYETRWDDGTVTWVDGSKWPKPKAFYYRDTDAPR